MAGPKHLRIVRRAGVALSLLWLAGCALLTPLPEPRSLDERLKQMPREGLPLRAAVTVYWDEHQIPFIEAESDTDAAFALGLVHAHLRLGQMEILRRISQGRLAEMGGPIATDIDHALRILGFGRVSPGIVAAMPADSRAWLDAFVAGINHYQATADPLPHEFALLGLGREPWRPEEVITLGRLASTDINWLVWFRLMAERDRPDWPELWARLLRSGSSSAPSFEAPPPPALAEFEGVLGGLIRPGSNAVVVGAGHSATGNALLATDPHLNLALPNLWLVGGIKSPSYHAVGLMVPGLPFVAVGRNPWIAWAGTNLRAAASDLFDASKLPPAALRRREERVKVRWWFDRTVAIRDSDLGPIISDAPMLPTRDGETLALKWVGHRASDELTAMLRLGQARDWAGFRDALDGFAISPQNMLYADAKGNIGQVIATHLPARSKTPPDAIVRPPEEAKAWERILTQRDLPASHNPPEGFLASANNQPAEAAIPIGYFFSSDDRITRLQELLGAKPKIGLADLQALQRDVYQRSAIAFRDGLMARVETLGLETQLHPEEARALDLVRRWDGHYRVDSAGAVAFEACVAELVSQLDRERRFPAYAAAGQPLELLSEDLAGTSDGDLVAALRPALKVAAQAVETYGNWGGMHRLSVAHVLGQLPIIGGRYRYPDLPTAGSSSTILKTAHTLTPERHLSRFGADARFLADLSDPDASQVVLMGGQDGWLNSSTFQDQIGLWQEGTYVRLPLTPEAVRARFAYRQELKPASAK